jgi:hypothetical protein
MLMHAKDYDMLVKTKEQIEEERASQERSRLVKKKRHGEHRVLIPVAGGQTRGGRKSRRRTRKNIWVDPALLQQQGTKPYARRKSRSER